VIWIQWVVGHLSDEEFVQLIKDSLSLTKVIIIKDNYCKDGFWFDEKDGNILRDLSTFADVFREANAAVVKEIDPETWPKQLMPIRVWVLQKKEQ